MAAPFRVEIMTDVADMASLMADADLAIGGAGSTAWERCCLGLPTLIVILAENQAPIAAALHAAGAACALGHVAEEDFAHRLLVIIGEVAMPEHLSAMSTAASRITDGCGVARVSRRFLAPRVRLRDATGGDAADVLAWRSDVKDARYYRGKPSPSPEAHFAWFRKALADPYRRLLIAEVAGQPVAHLRLDLDAERPGTAEASVVVAPECRGQRISGAALTALEHHAAAEGLTRLRASIHVENTASIRAFQLAGYVEGSRKGAFVHLFRTLSQAVTTKEE